MIPVLVLIALAAPVGSLSGQQNPALAAAPKKRAPKPPPRDLLLLWLEADDLVTQGDPGAALARIRTALTDLRKVPENGTVNGPGGAVWTRTQAMHQLALKGGDVARLVAWSEAVPLYELAVKTAGDRQEKREAKVRLEGARQNIEAGVERAPSFLGDDIDALVEEPWKPDREKLPPPGEPLPDEARP